MQPTPENFHSKQHMYNILAAKTVVMVNFV